MQNKSPAEYTQRGFLSFKVLSSVLGKTRQAYYDRSRWLEQQLFNDAILVDLVKSERQIAKRVGAKRLYDILKPEILSHTL